MKKCTKCLTEKPLSEFYRSRSRLARNGEPYVFPHCKQCSSDAYKANSVRQRAANRKNYLQARYGFTVEEYEAHIAKGCAVCGSHQRLHVDHCHATGNIRGILCSWCNVAIGNADDSPQRLRALAEYLESGSSIGQGMAGAVDAKYRKRARIPMEQ